MLRVVDLMSKSVLTLSRGTSIAEAARALDDNEVGGAPVVDADQRVVGLFAISDVAHHVGSHGKAETVGDAMARDVVHARPDDLIDAAVKTMAFEGVHRLVVLEDDGALAGVLTAMDVLKAIADGRLSLEEAPVASRRPSPVERTGPGTA